MIAEENLSEKIKTETGLKMPPIKVRPAKLPEEEKKEEDVVTASGLVGLMQRTHVESAAVGQT